MRRATAHGLLPQTGRVLCCAGLLFSACMGIAPAQAATLTPTQGVAIFAPSLRAALIDRDKTLATPRSAMAMSNGQSVSSCDSYLQTRRAGATPLEEVNVQLLMSEYILCEALDLLPAPLTLSKHRAHGLGLRLASQLDLRTIPSSLGPQLDDKHYTLQSLSKHVKTTATSASIEDKSASISFSVVAELDIDQDGKLDWIVWLADESREGNYPRNGD